MEANSTSMDTKKQDTTASAAASTTLMSESGYDLTRLTTGAVKLAKVMVFHANEYSMLYVASWCANTNLFVR